MTLKLGDTFPDFDIKSTIGDFNFYNYLGDSWGILFSHPADYTPVCTTELGAAAKYAGTFKEVTRVEKIEENKVQISKKKIIIF